MRTKLNPIDELVSIAGKELRNSKMAVALTGAGISVESGVPPFRGKSGLWTRYEPNEYAHIEAFKRNPEKVWQMLKELLDTIQLAKPNPAHLALSELEELGHIKGVITQNVDSLHQAAGSKNVVELHGNNRILYCMECKKTHPVTLYLEEMPPRCVCGYVLRPDVVLFGEPIPYDVLIKSYRLAKECDLMLVIGTSAMVSPASEMPIVAKKCGAGVLEINTEETLLTTYFSDWTIKGRAGVILPKIVDRVREG